MNHYPFDPLRHIGEGCEPNIGSLPIGIIRVTDTLSLLVDELK